MCIVSRVDFIHMPRYCKSSKSNLSYVSEWQKARFASEGSLVRFSVDTSILVQKFSFVFRSTQLGEAHANEIKHDIHPEYIVISV